jgi:hypothetical protein
LLGLLRLNLVAAFRSIWRGPLVRPDLVRPLLLGPLVVARLLATGRRRRPLALPFFRGTCSTLTLTLFDCLPILFQNRPFDRSGAFDLFRNRGLANNIANRLSSERSASRSGNDVHLWSFVNDDATACAIEITIDAADVVDHPGAIDDRSVIHDDRVGTDGLAEMMNVHKDEQRWREHCASGTARSPTNVVRCFAPGHPGWRPFGAG